MRATTPFGFADEMRVGLRGTVRRVWGRRGVKIHQVVQFTYEWRYLFLVVDGRGGQLHWCWLDSMAAPDVQAAVGGVRQHTQVRALVWDGAPSHRDADVRAVDLALIDLPPYSPELNPAERIFQELRRAIEGRVYATLDDKVAAVEAELAKLEADPARVRSIADWDWINEAVERLPVTQVA
ncbi:MAG: transposase [Chloroflexi bacterium]|nr:transposase [Chloroflexota bacterium]